MVYSYCVSAGRQYIKDVLVDGQSHLLIIREETELPGAQVSWELGKCGQLIKFSPYYQRCVF